MLKYKIKIETGGNYIPIDFWDFYLSPDYTLFSGVTSTSSNLNTGDMVKFSIGESEDTAYVTTETFVRQGSVIYYDIFPITREKYYGKNVTYITYNGIVYYYGQDRDDSSKSGFTVNNINESGTTFFECDEDAEEIYLPVKSYIEDGKVQIGNETCYIDLDSQDDPTLKYNYMSDRMMEYNDIELDIDLKNREEWESLTRFYVYPDNHRQINVIDASPSYLDALIRIGDGIYYIYPEDETIKNSDTYVALKENRLDVSGLTACYGVFDFFKTQVDSLRVYLDEKQRVKVENVFTAGRKGDHLNINFQYDDETTDMEVIKGDIILAKSTRSTTTTVDVETDPTGKKYVVFGSEKYEVIPNLFDSVVINRVEYRIEYRKEDEGVDYGVIEINGSHIPMEIEGNKAKRMGYMFYKGDDDFPEYVQSREYNVNQYDGVRIGGEEYKVLKTDGESSHANIQKVSTYKFRCVDYYGLGSYVLEPIMNGFDLNEDDIEAKRIEICTDVGLNYTDYVFYSEKSTFGRNEITYRKVYDEQIGYNPDMTPVSSNDVHSPVNGDYTEFVTLNIADVLELNKLANYYTIPLVMNNTSSWNLYQEDILMNTLYKQEVKKAIYSSPDFEKDIYYPSIRYKSSDGSDKWFYELVNTIEINLHFRNRNLNTWKVYDDDSANCNWFITDRWPYSLKRNTQGNAIERASDLLGFLNFTDRDVFNRAPKLAKSFLRISFYNSQDPGSRLLLGTYTVFVDENELYKKYGQYGDFKNVILGGDSSTINVGTEEVINDTDYTFDGQRRLDSRFIIEEPLKSKTSSEGFYMYMYKGYSNGLHEETVYMTVEFNHAGIGKRIPFYLPMRWEGNEPTALLRLNDKDLPTLTAGIPLGEYYKMSTIPVKLIYSEDDKKYVYYLPEECVNPEVGREEKRIVLNLFEVKINENENY